MKVRNAASDMCASLCPGVSGLVMPWKHRIAPADRSAGILARPGERADNRLDGLHHPLNDSLPREMTLCAEPPRLPYAPRQGAVRQQAQQAGGAGSQVVDGHPGPRLAI